MAGAAAAARDASRKDRRLFDVIVVSNFLELNIAKTAFFMPSIVAGSVVVGRLLALHLSSREACCIKVGIPSKLH